MKGIKLILFQDGISGNFAEMAAAQKGCIKRGAWYVSDNATEEQRTILESFLPKQIGAARWGEYLGIEFVKIDISELDNIYHITMPYAEMKVRLLIGGDGKNPITLENGLTRMSITRLRVCDGIMWRYHDYGIDVEWEKTSSAMMDFDYKGN